MLSLLLLLVLAPAILATPLAPRIHFNHAQNKCLTVRGSAQDFTNGLPVQIADCTEARHWVIRRGSTTMRTAGSTYCLDGGTEPGNGDQLKIWKCQQDVPGQMWHYTSDNRIKLENQDFCMGLDDSFKVQLWSCSGADNQVWTI